MENLAKNIGASIIYKYPKQPAVSLTIVKFSDLTYIIIPLFNQYPMVGVKKNITKIFWPGPGQLCFVN